MKLTEIPTNVNKPQLAADMLLKTLCRTVNNSKNVEAGEREGEMSNQIEEQTYTLCCQCGEPLPEGNLDGYECPCGRWTHHGYANPHFTYINDTGE